MLNGQCVSGYLTWKDGINEPQPLAPDGFPWPENPILRRLLAALYEADKP